MVRLVAFLGVALAAGAGLALLTIHLQIAMGWFGAALLVGWAMAARHRWLRAEGDPDFSPGAPERVLWLRAAGLALIGGHLLTALMHPHIDLHVGQGNSIAVDSWVLTFAFMIACVVFRRDARVTDERHDKIVARGVAGGYATLAAAVFALALFLAFAPRPWRENIDDFVLGNVIVALLLSSYLAMVALQLALYRADARAETAP